MVTNILTLEEMRQRYDGEWLLIAYTEMDEQLRVIAGEVLAHSVDRDEVYAALPLGRGKDIAIECLAAIPEDLVFIR
jgi:hypothetical protein